MITVNEAALNEANRLLDEIDGNPTHPVNDARHPEHQACAKAYNELDQWRNGQQALLAKRNHLEYLSFGLGKPD